MKSFEDEDGATGSLVLLAELLAHNTDVEYINGTLHFIGDFDALPLSLQTELSEHHRELTAWIGARR